MDRHIPGWSSPLSPQEQAAKEHDEQAAAYFKGQLELVAEQKKYTRTIKWATVVMAVATLVMAAATAMIAVRN